MNEISDAHLLDAHGFFIVDPFLDPALLASLIREVESFDTADGSSHVRRGVAFARRNLLDLGFARDLIAQSVVRELMSAISEDLLPVRAILFDKTGAANWTVPWHQDRSIAVRRRIDLPGYGPWSVKAGVVHVQPPVEILQRMVTLRFHLDSCGPDNGPLRVVPGTHGSLLDQAEVEHRAAAGTQKVCATGAGGLLVMRPLILHASSPAATPSHRRVIHVEFGPTDLPGGLEWAAGSS